MKGLKDLMVEVFTFIGQGDMQTGMLIFSFISLCLMVYGAYRVFRGMGSDASFHLAEDVSNKIEKIAEELAASISMIKEENLYLKSELDNIRNSLAGLKAHLQIDTTSDEFCISRAAEMHSDEHIFDYEL